MKNNMKKFMALVLFATGMNMYAGTTNLTVNFPNYDDYRFKRCTYKKGWGYVDGTDFGLTSQNRVVPKMDPSNDMNSRYYVMKRNNNGKFDYVARNGKVLDLGGDAVSTKAKNDAIEKNAYFTAKAFKGLAESNLTYNSDGTVSINGNKVK